MVFLIFAQFYRRFIQKVIEISIFDRSNYIGNHFSMEREIQVLL